MNLKKRLKYYYRYIISSSGWRKWTSAQVLLALLAAGVFLTALTWTTPNSANNSRATAAATLMKTGTPSSNGQPPTPFPAEFYTNAQQTVGITFAGAILVLIVVIGVIVFMPKNESNE